jgi:hypothetical protein
MTRLALLLVLCAILPGCTTNSIRLDEFEDLKINESRPKDIKAESCGFLVGVIPFRMKSQLIRLDRQYRYSANGGAITNVRVRESWAGHRHPSAEVQPRVPRLP